ncbi:MAG: ABC transporter ATP-binding protein [Gammaproteobacteria bacterium]
MARLETSNLSVVIGDTTVCREAALAIAPGECWGVLGRNGAGKTTLLHTLAGLRPPATGEILLDGTALERISPRQRARQIGVLFQDESDPFPATVLETALIGRHPFVGRWAWEEATDIELARSALRTVHLDPLEDRLVSTLSGGERRRLALATLFTQDPELFLLDEPTNHLDLHFQLLVLRHLSEQVSRRQKSAVMILHDLNLAVRFCDHLILLLGEGEIATGPPGEVLTPELLDRLYQHPLVRVEGPTGPFWIPR